MIVLAIIIIYFHWWCNDKKIITFDLKWFVLPSSSNQIGILEEVCFANARYFYFLWKLVNVIKLICTTIFLILVNWIVVSKRMFNFGFTWITHFSFYSKMLLIQYMFSLSFPRIYFWENRLWYPKHLFKVSFFFFFDRVGMHSIAFM